jgi:hypothetical protein
MPIQIEIHNEECCLIVRCIGEVADEELIEAWSAAYGSKDWVPGMPELVDLSKLEGGQITAEGIRKLEEYCQRVYLENGLSEVKVAVYAPHPLGYGLTRMYQALVNGSPEQVFVTKDLDKARAFIGL